MPSILCGFREIPGGFPARDLLSIWGVELKVDIGFDPSYKLGVVPTPGKTDLPAQVDTGAGESCIDSQLAAQLNLPVVDRRLVAGAHGAKDVNMHLAQVHIPALGFTIYGAFAGVDLRAGGQLLDALLGRTFLKFFKMVYEGNTGSVEITGPLT